MSTTITETVNAAGVAPATEEVSKKRKHHYGTGRTTVNVSDRFRALKILKAKDTFAAKFESGKYAGKEIKRSRATLAKSDRKRAQKSAQGLTVRDTRVKREMKNTLKNSETLKKVLEKAVGYSDFTFQKETVQLAACYLTQIGQEARNEMAERATNPTTGKVRRIREQDVKGAFRKYNV